MAYYVNNILMVFVQQQHFINWSYVLFVKYESAINYSCSQDVEE